MKALCLLAATGACTLAPDPPHELDRSIRTFSVAGTHTAVVDEFDPLRPDNVTLYGQPIPEPTDDSGNSLLVLPAASDIAVGRRHACVLTPIGEVACWGDHTGGALGEHRACGVDPETGSEDCVLGAETFPSLIGVRDLAAGDDVTCALLADATVACWGAPSRLGGSRVPPLDPPMPVRDADGAIVHATRLVANTGTICAFGIAAEGALWCWGDGIGVAARRQPYAGVIDVAIGPRHRCVIDERGLFCEGDNRNGQCGDFAAARHCDDASPCDVPETRIDLDAVRVVVGERHTCVLVRDGSVVCFGSNELGQLGRDDAFLVGDRGLALDAATDLESGYAHVCARRVDDSLWCWGTTSVTEVMR